MWPYYGMEQEVGREGWTEECKRKFSEQHKIINAMTKLYKTVSSSAGQVIAGVIPIDIEIERRCVTYKIRKAGEAMFRGTILRKIGCKRRLNKLVMETWQDRWELELKGRWTARWWPMLSTYRAGLDKARLLCKSVSIRSRRVRGEAKEVRAKGV